MGQIEIVTAANHQNYEAFMYSVTNYKGRVTHKWVVPHTQKQFLAGIRNLMRFWQRLQDSKLLYQPLLESLQKLAGLFVKMMGENADYYLPVIFCTDLVKKLQGIQEWQMSDDLKDIMFVKVRNRGLISRCSVCGVRLVYPAKMIGQSRLDLTISMTSAPVGILCLHRREGKLKDLIREIESLSDPNRPVDRLKADLNHVRQDRSQNQAQPELALDVA